ncbi:lantibiotic dehydratase family protein [Nonomuraea sp. 3-1Str]|uniref:lantibiotic dehydratase n=1 Tax=Nonomuraea sp. 3-1Str TaxID=2929801 RepID=UPI00285D5A5A|nr:lantibiotic dehydratase [Nonomuraea sp. 3-1Str]MDR8409676.1 lantibiotic dehydratase family protein [Nonomuraea sp. 3-1Str]
MDDQMGDAFGVRVAGLPADGLEELRFTRTWALVDEILAEDHAEAGRGHHGEPGDEPDDDDQDDEPDGGPYGAGGHRFGRDPYGAPVEEGDDGDGWADEAPGALAEALAAELADRADALRSLGGDDAFLRGLACASPGLSATMESWLARPGAVPRRPRLARLARNVARAASTASPHAAFTINGLGRWADTGPALTPASELRWSAVPEVDLATVRRVWAALAERPALREAVRVRVNPSLWQEDGRLWFLGAGSRAGDGDEGGGSGGGRSAGGPFREPVEAPAPAAVLAEPAVAGALAWVRATPEPTVGALERAVAEPGVVKRLLDLGLLERLRPFADQALDPLADLAAWVEEVLPGDSPDRPWLPNALREAVEATYGERIRPVAGWLLARLGDTVGLGERGVRLETAVSTAPPAVCGRAAWQPVLRDLDAVRRLAAVFDPDLPVKLTAAEHFVERHGAEASVPFLAFYRDAPAACADLRALLDRTGPPGGSPGRRVARLRRETWNALYASPPDERGVLVADPDIVEKMAVSWPAYVRPPGSITCYGHLTAGPEFVLSTVTTGYGRGAGRTRHLLARAGVSVPDGTRQPVAECLGSFGNHLNLRPASAVGVDYPFTVTDGAELSLTDLRVSYDPGTLLLVLTGADGEPVRPAHLGMSAPRALPPAWSFLVRVFGEPMGLAPVPWRSAAAVDEVQARPRLQLGRVVLARAGWRMPVAELPVPYEGESDAAFVLRTARWLERHGIPRRFFVRFGSGRRAARRPFYVDVTDHFLLLAMARSAAGKDGNVVLEEALPDPADAPSYGVHGRRVTEYALDVSG